MEPKLTEKPGYYAVIPASVRYDKSLSPNAKLLYGEITALLNFKNRCFATNAYFSRLYDISESQISRLIKQLLDSDHVEIENETSERGSIRLIKLSVGGTQKCVGGVRKNAEEGIRKNAYHNNKSINNNIIKEDFQSSDLFKETTSLPKQPKKEKEKNKDAPIFEKCKSFWLDEFHPGWAFGGITGKNLYQLITKLKSKLTTSKPEYTEEDVINLFKMLCRNLPEWYKGKDIPIINSKFNELFEEIKTGLYGSRPAKGESIFRR
ncbi:MAG: hypothetical protein JWR05_3515 [Mucilaginibacter sp.]|nr:hypothetical protein [Mucilaginibacter sp.]